MKLPLYMSQNDVESLLRSIPKDHPMRSTLQNFRAAIVEQTDKMAELAARARTTQWWENSHQDEEKPKRLTKGEKLLQSIKKLSPEQLNLLKEALNDRRSIS